MEKTTGELSLTVVTIIAIAAIAALVAILFPQISKWINSTFSSVTNTSINTH